MTPKFVTESDFLEYWGVDLRDKLRTNDNDSDKVNTFLFRVERRLMNWIDKTSFRIVPWHRISKNQREHMKYAVLEQAMYMWRNGDISMDSAYDQERGLIAHPLELASIVVCQPAIDELMTCGLLNMKVQNRKRYITGDSIGMIGYSQEEDPFSGNAYGFRTKSK